MIPLWRIQRRQFKKGSAQEAAIRPTVCGKETVSFLADSRQRHMTEQIEEMLRDAKPEPLPPTRETSDRIFEQAFAEAQASRRAEGIRQRGLLWNGLCLGGIAAIALVPCMLKTAVESSVALPAVTAIEQTVRDSIQSTLAKRSVYCLSPATRQVNIARCQRYASLSKIGDLSERTTAWEAPMHPTCGYSTFALYTPQPPERETADPGNETEEPGDGSLLICIVHPEISQPAEALPVKETPPASGLELHTAPPECVVLTSISAPPADSEAESNLISMFHPEVQQSKLALATITML